MWKYYGPLEMHVSERVKDTLISMLSKAIIDGVQQMCTGALIERPEGLMLVRRSSSETFLPGVYELPGGGMEEGEDIIECLCREVLEETSIRVTEIDDVADSFDYTSDSGKKVRQFNFLLRGEGEIKLDSKEHDSIRYVRRVEDLDVLGISGESRRVIVSALKRR
jgi:8-oxo-dGTP diphosphatase